MRNIKYNQFRMIREEGFCVQKKLRLRFLLICWGLLTVFLAAIAAGIGWALYNSAVRDSEDALETAAETETLTDDTRGTAKLLLDGNGMLIEWEQKHLNLSESTLDEIVKMIGGEGSQGMDTLEYDNIGYRYLFIRQRGKIWVYLQARTQEQNLEHTLRVAVPLFALVGMLLLLPVSVLLSRWISKPIAAAWDKQSDFVSDATHELKTPLSVIAADTEAVLSNPNASVASQEQWLGSIRGETARMSDLVANLLFLAKIDAGEFKLDVKEFDLSEAVEGLCMEREAELFEAGRMMEYNLTPGIRYRGDWNRIQQMLDELLKNARQYTPEGGGIRVIVNHDRKQRIRIVISNTGDPISAKDLTKIFDRFYRADPSRSRETGGYGLGLCVAKSIAELHGGCITAESKNGINVFTVVFGDVPESLVKDSQNHT